MALVIKMTVDERWSVFEIECKYLFVLLHCFKYFTPYHFAFLQCANADGQTNDDYRDSVDRPCPTAPLAARGGPAAEVNINTLSRDTRVTGMKGIAARAPASNSSSSSRKRPARENTKNPHDDDDRDNTTRRPDRLTPEQPNYQTNTCVNGIRHTVPDMPSDECTSPTCIQCATIDTADQQVTVDASDQAPTTSSCEHINLDTQHKDPMLADMIDYLQHGKLPDDDKTARNVLLRKDQFIVRDNKLLHLGIKRRKNNKTDTPIAEQLCIPKNEQSTVLAKYHAQLLHCGYEKLYLSLKERVFWDNLYTDTRNYVANCKTCQVAKTNTHPTRAAIQCREMPPQIFQRLHIDHLKINVKGATHGFQYALVMVDAMSLNCEIVPVKTTSAEETCRVILKDWVAKYGVFSELVSDRHNC